MNVVVLIGRLARDPELRYISESQTAVCTFTLAVDRFAGGERKTDWPRITVFGKTAENCAKFLAKGRQAAVEGRIQTGSYQNKNGDTVYTTEIIANRVEFVGGSRNDSESGGYNRPQAMQGMPAQGMQSMPGNMGMGMDSGMGNMAGMGGMGSMSPMAGQSSSLYDESVPEGFEAIDDDDIPF